MLSKFIKLVNGKKIEEDIIKQNPLFKDKDISEIKFIPIDDDIDRMKFYGCYKGDKYIYQKETTTITEDQKPRIQSMMPAEVKTDDMMLAYERKELLQKGKRRMFLRNVKEKDEIVIDGKKYNSYEEITQQNQELNNEER